MSETVRIWPFCGYAPGNYMCKCAICTRQFQGDKRCIICMECAFHKAANARVAEAEAASLASPPPVAEGEAQPVATVDALMEDIWAFARCSSPTDRHWWAESIRDKITAALSSVPGKGWQTMDSVPKAPEDGPECWDILGWWPGDIIEVVYWGKEGWWPLNVDADEPWSPPLLWQPVPQAPSIDEARSAVRAASPKPSDPSSPEGGR